MTFFERFLISLKKGILSLKYEMISKIYIKYARASPVKPAPIDKIAKIARVNPSGKCVTST